MVVGYMLSDLLNVVWVSLIIMTLWAVWIIWGKWE